ncbi:hypothetical protein JL475_30235 [Streptomyces sp. M2CJ-2]|uniref:hypothetical protein n=1 Tax=Streptomyces sp. M2CJ-2 TaxID=2803948 RepID=UPI0019265D55|nr:hypothetical protein [Streptomyces sp. M2CJ-2]MBL3670184.1 hypothetical protein [Streptomyces sp. M2CJ-2]
MNEIQMLAIGLVLGAWIVAVWHASLNLRDARRSLDESRQARRRAAGGHFLNSLELYQVQQRYGLVP